MEHNRFPNTSPVERGTPLHTLPIGAHIASILSLRRTGPQFQVVSDAPAPQQEFLPTVLRKTVLKKVLTSQILNAIVTVTVI